MHKTLARVTAIGYSNDTNNATEIEMKTELSRKQIDRDTQVRIFRDVITGKKDSWVYKRTTSLTFVRVCRAN